MVNLKCYTDDVDTVIAKSPSDATTVWCAFMGEKPCDYPDMTEEDYWDEVPSKKILKITDGCIYENSNLPVIEKTVGDWIKEKGRSFLCSNEC